MTGEEGVRDEAIIPAKGLHQRSEDVRFALDPVYRTCWRPVVYWGGESGSRELIEKQREEHKVMEIFQKRRRGFDEGKG